MFCIPDSEASKNTELVDRVCVHPKKQSRRETRQTAKTSSIASSLSC